MEPWASRSRRSSAANAGWLVGLVALAGACVVPRTEIVVQVDSDLVVGEQLDAFGLVVREPEGPPLSSRTIELGNVGGRYPLPATFGVAPRGGDPDRAVRVELSAWDEDDMSAPLFETHRIVTFRKEKKLLLEIFLAAECIDVAATCGPDEACGRGGCDSAVVDPATLPEWPEG